MRNRNSPTCKPPPYKLPGMLLPSQETKSRPPAFWSAPLRLIPSEQMPDTPPSLELPKGHRVYGTIVPMAQKSLPGNAPHGRMNDIGQMRKLEDTL
jgi:hypothetical protein